MAPNLKFNLRSCSLAAELQLVNEDIVKPSVISSGCSTSSSNNNNNNNDDYWDFTTSSSSAQHKTELQQQDRSSAVVTSGSDDYWMWSAQEKEHSSDNYWMWDADEQHHQQQQYDDNDNECRMEISPTETIVEDSDEYWSTTSAKDRESQMRALGDKYWDWNAVANIEQYWEWNTVRQ
mmetsp:Transcript_35028/g.49742  ORF Transcript_35028/g.49742 Transcript_35028/m.49742 type:complete len:178 (-) Transcript_35028:134-667(-)